MKNYKKGISLIMLIITILVLIILASATILGGLQRTEQAKIATHNNNLSVIQEEVEDYYYYKDGQLPVISQIPYVIAPGSTLAQDITKRGEQSETFYQIDLTKIGKLSAPNPNDMYLVSSSKHTIYYLQGTTIKGVTYHSKIGNDIPMTQEAVNKPKLTAGMVPVKWTGSAWTKADESNPGSEWYDYSNGVNKWANVMLEDGCNGKTTFNGSMLVWIPRFTYKIDSNEHSSTTGAISIKFSNGTIDDTTNGYRIHPAFYWGGWDIPNAADMSKEAGGTELTGIWVGKFESSPVNGLQGINGDRIAIKANMTSWKTLKISNIFDKCRAMQLANSSIYGLPTNVDTHLMKNSEWSAVAYLSKYARGATEVTINPSTTTANGDILANQTQSTTGNVYGVYDMNGGNSEYVASYIDNANSNLDAEGSSLVTAENQYKDVLPKGATDSSANNYTAASKAYGFAMYETSSDGTTDASGGAFGWFQDYVWYPFGSTPFFARGGTSADSTNAGLYYTKAYNGGADGSVTFRVSCIIP